MTMTARVTEESTVVAYIASQAGTANTYYSDAISIDADTARRLVAYVNVGAIGTNATVDASLAWCNTSGGSYSAITSTAITQDTTGSHVHQLEATVENILANFPTAKYVKAKVITAVNATPFGVTVVGFDPAHRPVTAGTDVNQTTTYP